MENNKNKKSVKFQGDMLNFCDFIQVFVFTRNHHLKRILVYLCFSVVRQRHISGISVYNRTVTNIKTLCGPCIAAIAGSFVIELYCLSRLHYLEGVKLRNCHALIIWGSIGTFSYSFSGAKLGTSGR